ncbi:hypothetical protein KBC79_02665, partial [Candidatus Woesebacteria bacterium]|nr:hypothetical protein [Candidatus Woesebacteria bacterium]
MGEGVSPGERETVDHTQAIAQELRDKGVQVLGDEARQNPAQVRESLQKVSEQLPEVVADAQRAAEKLQQNPEYQALGQQVDNVVTALGQHSSPELKRLGQDAAFVQRLRDGDKAAWGELGTTTQQHETEEHKAQSEALSTAAAKFTEAFRQRDDKQLEVLEIWDDQEKQLYLGKDKGSKPIEGKAALVDKVIEQAEAIDDPQKRQEFLEKRARGNINDQIARAERKLTTLQTQLSELQAKKDRFIALAQADGQADKTQLDQERNALTEEMDLLRTNLADARDNGMLSSGDEYGARHFLSRIDTAIGNSDGGVLGPVSAGEISGLFDKLENETQALTVAELRIQQAREKVAEEATKAAARMSELIALDLNATSAQAELDDVVKKITQTPEGKIYSAETTVMVSALAEKVSKAREQMLSEED